MTDPPPPPSAIVDLAIAALVRRRATTARFADDTFDLLDGDRTVRRYSLGADQAPACIAQALALADRTVVLGAHRVIVHASFDASKKVAQLSVEPARIDDDREDIREGGVLHGYAIGELIGRGGAGVVFRARHQLLDRDVALKILRTSRARLLAEVRAASRITDPNVVTVHDVGFLRDGRAFIAMDLVNGGSLHERIRAARGLGHQEAITIASGIARALIAVHAAGIVHNDLKPANVLLTREGRPLLVDFGAATIAAVEEASRPVIYGTVPYMSPEQIYGEPTTPKSDLFALGIVIHEMITGTRPFDHGKDLNATADAAFGPVPPLAGREGLAPLPLRTLVTSLLAPEPAARPTSARAVLAKLESMLVGWEACA